jgi:hypothetical protein
VSACRTERALGPGFVGREFLGKARLLRNEVVAVDEQMVGTYHRLLGAARARARKSSVPRPDLLIDLERAYRTQMPETWRIRLDIQREKKSLLIYDWRVTRCSFKDEEWDDAAEEPGIGVSRLVIDIRPGVFHGRLTAHFNASLHAVARRFSRAGDVTREAVVRDLAALAHAEIPASPGELFEVAAGDGAWRGRVVAGRDGPIGAVRTFY